MQSPEQYPPGAAIIIPTPNAPGSSVRHMPFPQSLSSLQPLPAVLSGRGVIGAPAAPPLPPRALLPLRPPVAASSNEPVSSPQPNAPNIAIATNAAPMTLLVADGNVVSRIRKTSR